MEKDKLPKEEEISSEELEQVNGGLTALNTTAFKFMKETIATPIASIDTLAINTTIKKI